MDTGKAIPRTEEVLVPFNRLKVRFYAASGEELGPGDTAEKPWFAVHGPGVDSARVKRVIFPDLAYDIREAAMVRVEMWTEEYARSLGANRP